MNNSDENVKKFIFEFVFVPSVKINIILSWIGKISRLFLCLSCTQEISMFRGAHKLGQKSLFTFLSIKNKLVSLKSWNIFLNFKDTLNKLNSFI